MISGLLGLVAAGALAFQVMALQDERTGRVAEQAQAVVESQRQFASRVTFWVLKNDEQDIERIVVQNGAPVAISAVFLELNKAVEAPGRDYLLVPFDRVIPPCTRATSVDYQRQKVYGEVTRSGGGVAALRFNDPRGLWRLDTAQRLEITSYDQRPVLQAQRSPDYEPVPGCSSSI